MRRRPATIATIATVAVAVTGATVADAGSTHVKRLTATPRVAHWRTPQVFGARAAPVVVVTVNRHELGWSPAGRLSAVWYGEGVIVEVFGKRQRAPLDFYVISLSGRRSVTIQYGT